MVSRLVFVLILLGPMLPAEAGAQDAMSDRYAAIRAPTEALIGRIGRNRLQADLNALTRERVRVQGLLRQTERLRLQDPVSGLAAAEHALDGRLDRLGAELRETRARLAALARERGGPSIPGLPTLGAVDPGLTGPGTGGAVFEDRPMAESLDDARAFVEDLLRANRARP